MIETLAAIYAGTIYYKHKDKLNKIMESQDKLGETLDYLVLPVTETVDGIVAFIDKKMSEK